MPIFPIDGQSLELGAADVGAEFFLQRVPPPGWIGGDCTAGAVLTSSELVAAVIDRVRAYPTGLEFWVTFHPTTEFAEPLVLALKTPRLMPDNIRSMRATGDVPGPTVDVVTSDGNVIRPEIAVSVNALSTAAATGAGLEEPRLYETGRLNLPPLSFAICFWMRGPHSGAHLVVRLRWPEADLADGSAAIDLDEVRTMASRARQLVSVRFPPHGG